MKTDRLIETFAADTRRPPNPARLLGLSLPAAAILSGVLLVVALGLRDNVAAVLASPVLFKTLLPLGLGLAAVALALRLARPGQRPGWPVAGIAAALALASGSFLLAFFDTPAPMQGTKLLGDSIRTCLMSIPTLAVPLLAAMLWALRQGASLSPGLSGLAAGLAAGALSAAIYSLHCPEDSPLFFVTWYGLAILAVTLAGRFIGARLLRW
jgi:hypothetical protein